MHKVRAFRLTCCKLTQCGFIYTIGREDQLDKIRILLIEDNIVDAKLISSVLKRENSAVVIKHIDSFELFKAIIRNDNYDLILTDYNCITFTGLDVVKEIRARKIEIPIIIITGEQSIEAAMAAMNLLVDDYIIKNKKNIKRLPAIIDRVLKKAHLEEFKRNTNETLSSTLSNYINLYETSSDLTQSVWADGSLMNVNNMWCKTLGYKSNEIIYLHIDQIIDPEWIIEFENLMEAIKTGSVSQSFEMGFITKSGEKLCMEGYVTRRVEYKKVVATHWIMRDISQARAIENILSEINDQYMSVFEFAPNPMVLGDHRGVVLQINKLACDLVGYSYDEMIGKHIRNITHPIDILKSLRTHRKLMSGELNSYTMFKRYRHKKGHYVKVEVTAALIRNEKNQPRFGIAEFKALQE